MKIFCFWLRSLALFVLAPTLFAQVPQLINYQGRVAVGTVNFDGSGSFKFALVNAAGTATYWSNDGTSATGSQPTAAVALNVTKGLYSVLLGDTTLANMTVIPASVFNNTDVRLRVWFNDGANGSQLLTPDQRIAAVGYAMIANGVPSGAITSAMIASGAVGSTQLASGAAAANLSASGQSGVASGGMVLSLSENNSALVNAGYVKLGNLQGSDTWQARLNETPPSVRSGHTAVWTGTEMIIWGGYNGSWVNDGARYNRAANSWIALSNTGAPTARNGHTAVWTGTEMIIWGGENGVGGLNSGARYSPSANIWTVMSSNYAPGGSPNYRAVWTGNEMVVSIGGGGGRYNPVENTWMAINGGGNVPYRFAGIAVWTGSEMIIWGGYNGSSYINDTWSYTPGKLMFLYQKP